MSACFGPGVGCVRGLGVGFVIFFFFNQQLTEQLTPMLEINNGTLFGW